MSNAPNEKELLEALLEGTALADVPVQLRGVGPAGAAGESQLRALPVGTGATGVPGASDQADRASAARIRGCRWRRAGRRWT